MTTRTDLSIKEAWRQSDTVGHSDLELLVYQSRLLGTESRLVLWGGGNTSIKTIEKDFRGRETRVLRVKGSGSDLKSVTAADFPGVRLEDVLPLLHKGEMTDEAMVSYLAHTLMEPSSPRPSIETLLHAFIPARSVVHSHADAILALTNNTRSEELLSEVFAEEVVLVPYLRPGFQLSKNVGRIAADRPELSAIILANHGLMTWGDDPREAYRRHVAVANRAAHYLAKQPIVSVPASSTPPAAENWRMLAAQLAPTLRGLLGSQSDNQRLILRFDHSDKMVRFASGQSLPFERVQGIIDAGAATPDHILNTKRHPLLINPTDPTDPASLEQAARQAYETYLERYTAYFRTYQTDESMLPPVPRVIVVAGLGIFTSGKDSRAATISNDLYHHTIDIAEAAESAGHYQSLSAKDGFEAEYWPLELYKLARTTDDRELIGRVAVVTGAAGAIGSGIARTLAAEGAHVVCADINMDRAKALAEELNKANPTNHALAIEMNVADEESVQHAYQQVAVTFGGVDILVANAGIAHNCPLDELALEDWQRSLDVNTTGHFLVTREALKIMKAQGTGGSLIYIASKNVPAPGKDFGAYSAAKAAQAQLARVAALEGGSFGIRSNIVNPDAIFADSGLWSQQVREERARSYGIAPEELEEFYRRRNLLNVHVSADDVAAAALFFASDRSAKTTGGVLSVDGGLREAFVR